MKEGWIARKAETGNPKDDKLSWYTLEDTEYLCAWTDESWRGMKSAKLKTCIPLEGSHVDYTVSFARKLKFTDYYLINILRLFAGLIFLFQLKCYCKI